MDESGLEGLKREPLALPRSSNPLPCKRLLSLISYQRARAILAMPRDESLKSYRAELAEHASVQARFTTKITAISARNVHKKPRSRETTSKYRFRLFIAMNVIAEITMKSYYSMSTVIIHDSTTTKILIYTADQKFGNACDFLLRSSNFSVKKNRTRFQIHILKSKDKLNMCFNFISTFCS